MMCWKTTPARSTVFLLAAAGLLLSACTRRPEPGVSAGSAAPAGIEESAATGVSPEVRTLGEVEVTAELLEIPEGTIFKRDLYNYTGVFKYKVLQVHRGTIPGNTFFVGHYNPIKPRAEAADQFVTGIGGDLKVFQAGQVHRMALVCWLEDEYMGGIVNKYFGREETPDIYWAVWTNLVSESK